MYGMNFGKNVMQPELHFGEVEFAFALAKLVHRRKACGHVVIMPVGVSLARRFFPCSA